MGNLYKYLVLMSLILLVILSACVYAQEAVPTSIGGGGMINSSANVSYDSAILDAFRNQPWVRILVRLKDNSGIIVTGTKEEEHEIKIVEKTF